MIELPVTLTSTGGAVSFASPVPLGYTKNKGVYRLLVTAEGEWEGLTIRCFWHLPGGAEPASSLVQDGAVDVPASVTAHPGNGCITFEGSDGVKTVTSADLRYRVGSNSGTEDGTMPEPGTPAWEQLVSETAVALEAVQKQIGNLDDLTTKAKETLVAAINEAARTGSGGAGSITMRTDGGYIQYSTDDGSTWENLIALAELKGEPGENGADGSPGQNGADGAPGADGYSPTASVEQSTDGAKITITDKSGTTEAQVLNGKDGRDGTDGAPGRDGVDGQPGKDGTDGITPTIGDNGNWYLGETDTGKPSRGEQGEKGDTGAQGAKGDKGEPGAKGDTGPAGVPGKDGAKGDPGAPGKDGHSPVVTATKSGKTTTISVDGAAIATVEDGADGKPGAAGSDGITPHIGDNGNWYIGSTDTGKPSRGAKGDNGDTTVVDAALDGTSNNPVQNKAIYAALAAKAERVNSAKRTVRVEISGTFVYVYFFSGSGYWVRLCFQSRSASGQNYTIMRLNGARASKDRDFGTYITIVPEGYLEYVFAARIGGSNGAWVGGFAHGYENATKTVISLDSMPLTGDGTYYGRELRLEQTSEIYNPTGGAKIADHYVLNTITADDGWRVAQTIKWVSAVKLSADTYLCMFALTRNSIAKMARNYDYTLCNVPAYGESNATLGAKVDASACVMTGDIDCEVEQLETSGNDCHLFYGDNTYQAHYKVYFRFLTGETEIASGTVFSGKFRVAFNSQLSAVSSNVIHGDEYYTKDETESKIAELLGVVENGTY